MEPYSYSPIYLHYIDRDDFTFIFMYLGRTGNFREGYKHSVYIDHRSEEIEPNGRSILDSL